MIEDLVFVTDGLCALDIVKGYENYSFPWPVEEDEVIPWFRPSKRGVLFFKELHISKSNKKLFKNQNFQVKFCTDFESVIEECRKAKRKDQQGTWITQEIKEAYIDLFAMKKAYSVEVYSKTELVGGLYGVISKGYVSGESMFFKATGASKFALVCLVEKLKSLGLSFIDTQMVTPLIKGFGGREISHEQFKNKAEETIIDRDDFFERLKSE